MTELVLISEGWVRTLEQKKDDVSGVYVAVNVDGDPCIVRIEFHSGDVLYIEGIEGSEDDFESYEELTAVYTLQPTNLDEIEESFEE